jgi:hypothetical protein
VGVRCRLTYEARIEAAANPMARRCLEIMARKRTNLSVAADVATADEMLELAEKVGAAPLGGDAAGAVLVAWPGRM